MTVAPLRPPAAQKMEGVTQGHSYPSHPATQVTNPRLLSMPGSLQGQGQFRNSPGGIQYHHPWKASPGPSVPQGLLLRRAGKGRQRAGETEFMS